MHTLDTLGFLLWIPNLLTAGVTTIVWFAVAVQLSRHRDRRTFQVSAVVLGCAHAASAGRCLLVGMGFLTTDPVATLTNLFMAGACLSVGVCIVHRSLGIPPLTPVLTPVPIAPHFRRPPDRGR